MKLQDKVAVITGGGQGIGEAYAHRYAREGAKVVVADINFGNAQKVAKAIQNDGGQSLPLHVDVTNESSTLEMAAKTVEHFGRLDILLNNAAIYYGLRRVPWDKWTLEEWNNLWNVNVVGIWLCTKACVPYMKKQPKGKIINITSAVIYSGQPLMLPYNCSKAAVDSLTKTLSKELGVFNITVNSIAPGFVLTDASVKAYPADQVEKRNEMIRNMRCIKRDQSPEDMVGAAVFFASDDSDFITGQSLLVDGGILVR